MTDQTPEPTDLSDDEEPQEPDHVDPDVNEADALEQARSWGESGGKPKLEIAIDVPEADAVEQAQDVGGADEDEERR
jgi:hypothetical protein